MALVFQYCSTTKETKGKNGKILNMNLKRTTDMHGDCDGDFYNIGFSHATIFAQIFMAFPFSLIFTTARRIKIKVWCVTSEHYYATVFLELLPVGMECKVDFLAKWSLRSTSWL